MIILLISSFMLLSIMAVVVLIDLVPKCKEWLERIHIGRYTNTDEWINSITNRGVKWLIKTPKIQVTDNTRLIAIDILRRNYSNSTIQSWQEAALILGLVEYLKRHDNKDVKHQIEKYLDSKFDSNGEWRDKPKHIDAAILAYAVMKIDFINTAKYKKALDYTWEVIQEHIGSDGTVEYRKFMKGYRYVDTIGFICPYLVSYGIRYGNDECIELAVKQIKEYERYGTLDTHYLPCHAYELDKKLPVGLFGWGRGLGWFAIGLIDSWNELQANSKYKPVLEESVKNLAKSARSFQQSNGGWNWMVARNESRPDSSTTAILGWFMLNASKINDISNECLESTNKAITYLKKVTRRNGAIDFSQGDTKDIGVYSGLFNILPFTQGYCIRCINLYKQRASEIIREKGV